MCKYLTIHMRRPVIQYMTLQTIPSEFPYIRGNFFSFLSVCLPPPPPPLAAAEGGINSHFMQKATQGDIRQWLSAIFTEIIDSGTYSTYYTLPRGTTAGFPQALRQIETPCKSYTRELKLSDIHNIALTPHLLSSYFCGWVNNLATSYLLEAMAGRQRTNPWLLL
jgi:hypothetical protein